MAFLHYSSSSTPPEIAMALLHYCTSSTPPPPSPLLPFRKSTSNSLLFTVPALHPLCFCFTRLRPPSTLSASLVVDSPTTSGKDRVEDSPKVLLEVKDLFAVIADSKQPILKGVNLVIYEGEVHAIMGKNSSGKSTFDEVELDCEAILKSLLPTLLLFVRTISYHNSAEHFYPQKELYDKLFEIWEQQFLSWYLAYL